MDETRQEELSRVPTVPPGFPLVWPILSIYRLLPRGVAVLPFFLPNSACTQLAREHRWSIVSFVLFPSMVFFFLCWIRVQHTTQKQNDPFHRPIVTLFSFSSIGFEALSIYNFDVYNNKVRKKKVRWLILLLQSICFYNKHKRIVSNWKLRKYLQSSKLG